MKQLHNKHNNHTHLQAPPSLGHRCQSYWKSRWKVFKESTRNWCIHVNNYSTHSFCPGLGALLLNCRDPFCLNSGGAGLEPSAGSAAVAFIFKKFKHENSFISWIRISTQHPGIKTCHQVKPVSTSQRWDWAHLAPDQASLLPHTYVNGTITTENCFPPSHQSFNSRGTFWTYWQWPAWTTEHFPAYWYLQIKHHSRSLHRSVNLLQPQHVSISDAAALPSRYLYNDV